MASNEEEPQRFLGMPLGTGPAARQGEEEQHVLGLPVSWLGPADRTFASTLRHPVRAYKRWAQRRRMGPYAPE